MSRKIKELRIIEDGGGKCTLTLSRSDFLAIQFGLIEGIENPKKFFIFPSSIISLYTTINFEKFSARMENNFPNLVHFTNGEDLSKESFETAKMEWGDLKDEDKWMLLKAIGYFGSDQDILRMKKVLKESDVIYFDWVKKIEVDEVLEDKKGFGGVLKEFMVVAKMKPNGAL